MAGYRQGFDKFLLLLWKNWRLQLRHPIQTFFEILVPVFFCAILVAVRSLAESEVVDVTTFSDFHLDRIYNGVDLTDYHVAYSPNHTDVTGIVNDALLKLNSPTGMTAWGYSTGRELENALVANPNLQKVGIVFPDNFKGLSKKMEFALRFPSEMQRIFSSVSVDTWKTNILYPVFQLPGPRDQSYYTASPGIFLS